MKNSGTGVKRILVVEDEPAICEVCRRVLTDEVFEVDIAANGRVAQDILGERDYDLCLIDIILPEVNGKQLYQFMEENYPEVISRVIFTTGDVVGSDTQSFIELARRPFLPKPFTPDELRAMVRKTLRQLEK